MLTREEKRLQREQARDADDGYSAFELGYDAARRGFRAKVNPFHAETGEAMAWRNGWKEGAP